MTGVEVDCRFRSDSLMAVIDPIRVAGGVRDPSDPPGEERLSVEVEGWDIE